MVLHNRRKDGRAPSNALAFAGRCVLGALRVEAMMPATIQVAREVFEEPCSMWTRD